MALLLFNVHVFSYYPTNETRLLLIIHASIHSVRIDYLCGSLGSKREKRHYLYVKTEVFIASVSQGTSLTP